MRRRTTRRVALPAALWAIGCWSGVALAAPGDHVRAGDAVITPSLTTGLEYHSNVYLSDDKTPQSAAFGGTAWILQPRVGLELEGADVQFNLGAGWGVRKYLDFNEDNPQLQNADRFNDFDANLGLAALNRNVIGLRLDDKFEIQNSPSEMPTLVDGNANVVHLSNDLNGGIAVRPGSALELGVLGNLGFDRYTVPEEIFLEKQGDPNINNRANYGPVLDIKWRFLPKTTLSLGGSLNWLRWDNNLVEALGPEVEGASYGAYIGKPDAFAWRTGLGLKGQFTAKLALAAEIGYGQMLYDEQSVIDSAAGVPSTSNELAQVGEETFARDLTSFGEGFTANAQVAYAPIKGQTFTLGYKKDFQDAFFTNYVVYNYAFLRYEGLFASRFGATGEFTYRIDAYHGEVARSDQNLRLKLGGAYRFNDYLSASLSGGWSERACLESSCEGGVFFSTQYDDLFVTAGATFTY